MKSIFNPRSKKSKSIVWLLLFSVFFTQTRCVAYRQVGMEVSQVKENTYFTKNLVKYRLLVHDSDRYFEVKNPVFQGSNFTGEIIPISEKTYKSLESTTNYFEKRKNKNCIFLTTSQTIMPLLASSDQSVSSSAQMLDINQITSVNGFVVDDGETFVRTFLIILLSFVVVLFLVLILAATAAANSQREGSCLFCSNSDGGGTTTTNGGSSDSGGSGSGSGSGDSGSGSGSGSGSSGN